MVTAGDSTSISTSNSATETTLKDLTAKPTSNAVAEERDGAQPILRAIDPSSYMDWEWEDILIWIFSLILAVVLVAVCVCNAYQSLKTQLIHSEDVHSIEMERTKTERVPFLIAHDD